MFQKIKNWWFAAHANIIPYAEPVKEENTEESTEESVENIVEKYIKVYTAVNFKPKAAAPENGVQLVLQGITLGDMFGRLYEGWALPENETPETVDPFKKNGSNFTDDTVMAIAIYEAAKLARDLPQDEAIKCYAKAMRKYAKKYPTVGYGPGFYNWAVLGIDSEEYKSCGDGGAMRAGAIGALFDSYQDVVTHAVYAAMPTHSHPEGIKGSVVTAVLVWMGLHGYSKNEMLKYALECYYDGFEDFSQYNQSPWMSPKISLQKLIDNSKSDDVYTSSALTQIAMPEAIVNVMNSTSYEECIRNSVRYICDADTVAAISGAIAAALYKETQFNGHSPAYIIQENHKFTDAPELWETIITASR